MGFMDLGVLPKGSGEQSPWEQREPLLGCFHTELKSEEEIHVDIDKSIDLDINMDMDMDMDTDTDMDMDKTGLRFGLKC